MLATKNAIQVLFAWLASGRPVDLVSAWRHAPYLTRHRLAAIDARIRIVAVAFSLATLIWIALDAATLGASLWPLLATCRVFAALVLIRLAIAPDLEQSRARALTMLGIFLAMPLMIYGVSQIHLAGIPLQGLAAINGNLYKALPLIVLASLSIFPLAASEGLLFAAAIAAAVAGIEWFLAGVNAIELFSTLWIFILVMGIYLIGCAIQLNHMMAMAHRASHDPLTGALTRRSGTEVLDLHLQLAGAQDAPLSMLFVSAGNLKSINGNFGHDAGDRALKDIAAKLHALLRLADVVIRWRDEAFVVILANTPMHGARLVVDRIIHDLLGARPGGAPLMASIGLAERQTDGAEDWWQLIALSEKRMRVANTSGKVGLN